MRVGLIVLLALLPAAAHAQDGPQVRDGGSFGALRVAGTEDPDTRKVYIVQLAEPSAAQYHASLVTAAARATGQAASRVRFDKSNAVVQSYSERLLEAQNQVIARAGDNTELIYQYRFGLNGFAARMHPSQAHKLEGMPEVLRVWEDEVRPLATRYSPDFLGLFDKDVGLRAAGLDGEDVIIGVIDSGIAPKHPALSDTREADRPRLCQGSWAENSLLGRWLCRRYRVRDDVLLYAPPENWNGACIAGEQFAETDCNNKLIGARWFADGARATGPIDEGEIFSARDVDGHGTHTATTAAGNRVKASIFNNAVGRVQGIAPRARIAVYKACWLRPGDLRASCNTSDLANAIDAAVADGVDIINYSVGSSLFVVTSPDDLALMAAAKAGVLAVVAAGNEGPNLATVGSPAGGPWAITVAASSRDGETKLEALEIKAPPSIAALYRANEANFTPPLLEVGPVEADLVLVDDGNEDDLPDGSPGTTSDACQEIVNASEVTDKIALIQRGGCDFDEKISNAADAGAVAALVYNIAGDPIVMNGDSSLVDIPAMMIGQADGNLILAEIDDGNTVTVLLDKALLLEEPETGNVMATFSARGPGPSPGILKPDVTAPGVNILAGFTPDAANAMSGENFAFLSGTSMSTPHVAGTAALLLQANPDWTPGALKSAMMTTARQTVFAPDGETPAHAFDFGAGHIVPNDALDPGVVYDVTDDEYDAFGCGTIPRLTPDGRCDDLQAAGFSFDASDLNQPSIALPRLANERTVTRRVTNVSDQAQSLTASVEPPSGVAVSVAPATISVPPGQSASFNVTFSFESGPLDFWRFGSLTWESNERSVYSPLAIRPISVTAPAQRDGIGVDGTLTFPVEFGYSGAYTPSVHGLRLPYVETGFVDNDPTKTFSFRTDNGVTAHTVIVPPDQAYLRFALFDEFTDGNPDDLDLYVYYCPDNVDCFRVGESGEATSNEEVNFLNPEGGRYVAFVHGFETDPSNGAGANYQVFAWSFGLVDNVGNMTAAGPALVNAGTTENVTVNWTGLDQPNSIYLGGVGHNTPQGLSAITIIRIATP